jgi:hypothetical protein
MKKLVILSTILLLMSGCVCTFSQVPPQTIYINANCQGVVPDFRPIFTYSDNCKIDTIIQDPAPGYILTAEANSVNMQIIVLDVFNNFSTTMFPVTVFDTICPEIFYNGMKVAQGRYDTLYFSPYQTPVIYISKK